MIFTKEMLDIWRANPPGGTVSYDIVTSLLDTITDLERQHDENIKQLKIDILAMSQAEEKILLLKSERDTAHAAAIQAAHGIVDTAFTGNWMIQDTLDAVLALTLLLVSAFIISGSRKHGLKSCARFYFPPRRKIGPRLNVCVWN